MTSQQQNDSNATSKTRSPLLYAIPAAIAILVGMYFVTRPPSGGVFCSSTNGCYEVNFGSWGSDGTIAFYLPGGDRSRPFPLVREQSGDYSASFTGDGRLRFVLQDRDHLVRDDQVTYARTSSNEVAGVLDAVRKKQDLDAAVEQSAKAAEQAKAQQVRITNLLTQLAGAQDEASRTVIQKQLEDERAKMPNAKKDPVRTGPQKPCACQPADPLCSCL